MNTQKSFCSRCAYRQLKSMAIGPVYHSRTSVYLPCDCEIDNTSYVTRTGKAIVALDMPRRQIADWACDTIERFDRRDGNAYYRDGTPYDLASLPDFGEAFGEDAAASNIRDLMGYAVREPSRLRQECRDRVRLLTTAMAITMPSLMYNFDL
ncbi:hypothetical protein [Novosphingobium album (ex Liu et al. 2023)]|uniref:Uncharacterized protein n=1 Tax=Novosphingobium album (ex Liu et al. 2023) TaxID=3031130 RepID=A0ABT5WWC8_9SPHN|nr:hypothetical protein [Novosphingobium album (ex Liu et al. 2023)]MDE8654205.1 hypothetical protein [Novosphingobium album (ex Liu et al. 2023)]